MASPTYQFVLADIKTDTPLLDVTEFMLSSRVSPRLNRPHGSVYTLPSTEPSLHTRTFDGDPMLHVGTRSIKFFRNGILRANDIVWNASYAGGPDYDAKVELTCVDSLQRTNYRHVFDSVGRIADPDFSYLDTNPDPTITSYNASALLQSAIINSLTFEDNFGDEALLPLDVFGGVFNATANIAAILADTPITIGELVGLLTDTGVVDVVLDPVDSTHGAAAGILHRLNVYNAYTRDRSGAVHLDYGVGSKNCSAGTRTLDMTTVGNRITYELGPKKGKDRFRGNITGTELTPVNLSAWQALQRASRRKYGTFASLKVYDDDGDADARPLFHQLWKTEVVLRVNPRDLLYLTPQAGLGLDPWDSFRLGDQVGVNTGYLLGPDINGAKQRIYGFDVEWTNEDPVERVTQLVTSADAEGGP